MMPKRADSPADGSRDDDEVIALPRRRVWPFMLAVLAMAGVAGFAIYRSETAPKPLRVLVSVDFEGHWWEGSPSAATLSDTLGDQLTKLGFDVVRAGDAEAMTALGQANDTASIDKAARKLRAAFVIEATLTPEEIVHDVGGGYHELRVDAPVKIHHLGQPSHDAGRMVGFSGATDGKQARNILAKNLADQAFDAVLTSLLDDPELAGKIAERTSNESTSLAPAVEYRTVRDARMKQVAEGYEQLGKVHLAQENGPQKPVYLSAPMAHDELAGVGPLGALVGTNGIRPFFFPDRRSLGWINELETLEWRAIGEHGAGKSSVAWRGYNLYGYSSVTPDGTHAAIVEDLFGWAKAVTLIDSTKGAKSPRRLLVEPRHKLVEPRLSPDGAYVAFHDRDCNDCPSSLLVLSTVDGKRVFSQSSLGGHFGGVAWLDGHRLAVLHDAAVSDEDTPVEPPKKQGVFGASGTTLWLVDLAASSITMGRGIALPKGMAATTPSASPDGSFVVLARTDQHGVVVIDLASSAVRTLTMPGELDNAVANPTVSPDGHRVACSVDTDDGAEIVVITLANGVATRLTRNTSLDRYPIFSSDGAHVIYETMDRDPAFSDDRRVVWIASIAAP